MSRWISRILLLLLTFLTPLACGGGEAGAEADARAASATSVQVDSSFAALVERLSEPGGYFDTDNLISNETSYLHVIGELEELGVSGGAYIGVGPDQNFSYIAHVRPSIAFIIDIRRDNLLQHLLFKAVFSLSRNRVEYLTLLLGRQPPNDVEEWNGRSLQQTVDYIDSAPIDRGANEATGAALKRELEAFGLPLSEDDIATIHRFHQAFIDNGLGLRFSSHGRAPLPEYPTYRRLLLETDLSGKPTSYLASEESFRVVKDLQERDLIVPVVGDLAGAHAMEAIADYIAELEERVSAFYTSNVEFYLFGDHSFDRYARNVMRLPRDDRSVIIRSFFGRRLRHPRAVPGHLSTQLLQPIEAFASDMNNGGYRGYFDLVLRDALD